jgi:hypothetical protein
LLSFLGGLASGLISKVIGWLALVGVGEQKQAAKDTKKTLDVVTAERDAADRAGSAEDAARRGRF